MQKSKLFQLFLNRQNKIFTAKNTVISPNFLIWVFYGKTQFPHSFVQIARNYAETVPFHKTTTPGNYYSYYYSSRSFFLYLRLEGVETLKCRYVCRPPCGKV